MTNSSGFGQTEENRVKDAANYARTSNDVRNSTEANKYLTAAVGRTQSTTESDPDRSTPGLTSVFMPGQPREGTGDVWATDPNAEGGSGSMTSETDELKQTYLPDQSFGDQSLLNELTNKQNILNMEVAAELDRVNSEFYTDLDIRRGQAAAGESRAGQRVSGEERRAELAEGGSQQRASSRVAGQEQRAGFAEQGSQVRATERVRGQEDRGRTAESGQQDRATSRVTGQEQRAGMAEQGSQTRGTRRVEGQEVRETDLQREMFRRYKESRDYDQAQRGARSY